MIKLKNTLCAAAVAGLLAVPCSAAHAWGNNWTPWGGNNGWGNNGWNNGWNNDMNNGYYGGQQPYYDRPYGQQPARGHAPVQYNQAPAAPQAAPAQ